MADRLEFANVILMAVSALVDSSTLVLAGRFLHGLYNMRPLVVLIKIHGGLMSNVSGLRLGLGLAADGAGVILDVVQTAGLVINVLEVPRGLLGVADELPIMGASSLAHVKGFAAVGALEAVVAFLGAIVPDDLAANILDVGVVAAGQQVGPQRHVRSGDLKGLAVLVTAEFALHVALTSLGAGGGHVGLLHIDVLAGLGQGGDLLSPSRAAIRAGVGRGAFGGAGRVHDLGQSRIRHMISQRQSGDLHVAAAVLALLDDHAGHGAGGITLDVGRNHLVLGFVSRLVLRLGLLAVMALVVYGVSRAHGNGRTVIVSGNILPLAINVGVLVAIEVHPVIVHNFPLVLEVGRRILDGDFLAAAANVNSHEGDGAVVGVDLVQNESPINIIAQVNLLPLTLVLHALMIGAHVLDAVEEIGVMVGINRHGLGVAAGAGEGDGAIFLMPLRSLVGNGQGLAIMIVLAFAVSEVQLAAINSLGEVSLEVLGSQPEVAVDLRHVSGVHGKVSLVVVVFLIGGEQIAVGVLHNRDFRVVVVMPLLTVKPLLGNVVALGAHLDRASDAHGFAGGISGTLAINQSIGHDLVGFIVVAIHSTPFAGGVLRHDVHLLGLAANLAGLLGVTVRGAGLGNDHSLGLVPGVDNGLQMGSILQELLAAVRALGSPQLIAIAARIGFLVVIAISRSNVLASRLNSGSNPLLANAAVLVRSAGVLAGGRSVRSGLASGLISRIHKGMSSANGLGRGFTRAFAFSAGKAEAAQSHQQSQNQSKKLLHKLQSPLSWL